MPDRREPPPKPRLRDLAEFPRQRPAKLRYVHPKDRARAARRTPILIAAGLTIGALLGLAAFSGSDHPAADARQLAHRISPNTLLAERQARLNARIPPGGFKSCAQAKAAGFGRIHAGQPAYTPWLDRDGDGQACEWNQGLFD